MLDQQCDCFKLAKNSDVAQNGIATPEVLFD